ncbi:MAG: adenylate kinase [Candidatus Altiarchaeales archaeon]|nr:adenylate kinase [Candidatus Altiarchaeales archaeon]
MLVVVTGIPGTGKTTVASKAVERLAEEGVTYSIVTYGTVMFEIAQEKKLVSNRDEMRKLSPKVQKEIQKKAAEMIRKMAEKGNIILDTHCSIKTPKGFFPGLPEKVLKKLEPDVIVIVESLAEEINLRRQGDKSRDRDDEGIEGIRLHQDMNRNFAAAYCVLCGACVRVIQNPQGRVEQAAGEMAGVLR